MNRLRALLIDDEEELVSALVERLGYRDVDADYVLGGEEAFQKMRQFDYDVVVLDLKLPGMSGADVLERIRSDHPNVPVIMITGQSALEREPEDRLAGAFDCLPKPIHLDALIAKMQEAIDSK